MRMRAARRIAVAGLWAGACLGSAALAQRALPAEVPPASFEGTQYVDNAGCAFIRAGVGGSSTFVPRLSASREPVCGLMPSATDAAMTHAHGPAVAGPSVAPRIVAQTPVVAVCSYGIVASTGRVLGGPACEAAAGARALVVSEVDPTRATASPAAQPRPGLRSMNPASNPVGVVPQVVPVARGYERVWEDGRVNPSRGVPQPVSGPVLLGAIVVAGD